MSFIVTTMQHLMTEALSHRAVRHPLLTRLADGAFPNTAAVLRDFAVQYAAYSAWFPQFLNAVIDKLPAVEHREHLRQNLREEQGTLSEDELNETRSLGIQDEWVRGIPHPRLFRQFAEAIGADLQQQPCAAACDWRQNFLQLLRDSTPAAAVGAIGPGTEAIVRHVYAPLLTAVQTHTSLSPRDYVFFSLHTTVDDEHAEVLLQIASQLAAETSSGEQEIRSGMQAALNLRAEFWDHLLDRATAVADA